VGLARGRWRRRQSPVAWSSDHRADGELSLGEKYTDAFWSVVPIPVALGVSLIAVLANPSGLGVVALVLIGVVGVLVELTICNALRRRWDAGLSPEAVGRWGEDSWWPAKAALLAIVMIEAATWKGHDTQGMSWGDAALFSLIGVPAYIAVIAVVGAIARALEHGD
jgi:hypothetical protein